MDSALRQYFESRAESLTDCASLVVTPGREVCVLRITPHRSDSLGIYLLDFGNNQFQLGFDHEHDIPFEDASAADDLDSYLEPAVEGRVRMLVGPRRAVIQVRERDDFASFGTHYSIGAFYPIPGWRRRANVVDFAPYRT